MPLEIDDLEIEPAFFEIAELVADIDRDDRVGIVRGLADRQARLSRCP